MAAPASAVLDDEPSVAALIAARPQLSMHAFDGLTLEQVPLARIADVLGTPAWVYSAGAMRARLAELKAAMAGLPADVHYAVKANDHLAVLRIMAAGGAGADVVSEGELRRARAAGIPASAIVFSGVGKTEREIRLAITEGIHQLNVESAEELEVISAIASALGGRARVALRVNPDVDAGTHAKITTGTAETKFGIPYDDVPAVYARAAALPGVEPVGLALHIGSQIMSTAPYRAAFARAAEMVRTLRAQGLAVSRMDCGGGLGIGYRDEPDGSPAALAGAMRTAFGGMDLELMVEPGRWLVGPAGVLLATVVLVKGQERFVVLDAAMNELMRPAMYDAWHGIVPLAAGTAVGATTPVDVVGPVCESSDTFARGRALPRLERGARVALLDAGAYGAVMSSTYNGRPLAPIALVDGDRWAVIRERQAHADLWAGERVPEFI
ncbi:Diaminopimelate decarboxylase [Rhodovastum atsumiense]|uniref:Diaminopimelate decarboxylase n=1 Tax=Rhodovastum atsumiense TaxID=504468 RepID=A0A5M6IY45_9PROT|nr:diaminopimelate decarboxylase [Rhodovastum atsumiense]KAA5613276.1 diaminopimelate decarboxylase [Rhodovastum atsumiense]CAH2600560.1 Diaminopimelate decarboxylase [Rhodovastum atsumiense]